MLILPLFFSLPFLFLLKIEISTKKIKMGEVKNVVVRSRISNNHNDAIGMLIFHRLYLTQFQSNWFDSFVLLFLFYTINVNDQK